MNFKYFYNRDKLFCSDFKVWSYLPMQVHGGSIGQLTTSIWSGFADLLSWSHSFKYQSWRFSHLQRGIELRLLYYVSAFSTCRGELLLWSEVNLGLQGPTCWSKICQSVPCRCYTPYGSPFVITNCLSGPPTLSTAELTTTIIW